MKLLRETEAIIIPITEGSFQTMPVDPAKRLADSEIQIQVADADNAFKIVTRQTLSDYVIRVIDIVSG